MKNTGSVVLAISVLFTVGCQSTKSQKTAYLGGMTQTSESNLLRYSNMSNIGVEWDENKFQDIDVWKRLTRNFSLSEPISFDLPLYNILDCGKDDKYLDGLRGTLTVSKAESTSNSWSTSIHGYVSSDQFDVSNCRATVEFLSGNEVLVGNGFYDKVVPEIAKQKSIAMEQKYYQAKQVADENWHVERLASAAEGIATIKVCMEKGTYFLANDKRAMAVISDAESHAKNKIHSKVTGKHYWDEQVYKVGYSDGLKKARNLWLNDYYTFSEQCAVFRNRVDALTNK
ncbi:TPA: hypothetical protein NKU35_003993 [Vibrio parahaemolyticus]|nr:hypothetical protein [Vibrio parahaemolyticus]HCH6276296.1 hypothetical protein [Vibrio parahaemolyticus]